MTDPFSESSYRLTVTVPATAFEAVAVLLRDRCGGALQIEDGETAGGSVPADNVRLIAAPPDTALPQLVFELRRLFRDLRAAGLLQGETDVSLDEDDTRWRRGDLVVRVAGRFAVMRPWVDYEPAPGEIPVRLEADAATGDARHPATALCLLHLARLAERPVGRVLDLGCGSGILSLAAALQWPEAEVTAFDVDARAVRLAKSNAARLGLGGRVRVREGGVAAAEGVFDVVLAHLPPDELLRHAGALKERLCKGGRLVTAGYPARRAGELERIFFAHGLCGLEDEHLADWAAVVFTW